MRYKCGLIAIDLRKFPLPVATTIVQGGEYGGITKRVDKFVHERYEI